MADTQEITASDTRVASTVSPMDPLTDSPSSTSADHQPPQSSDHIQSGRADGNSTDGNERYRTLFRLVPVALYSCDADGVIQEYNQRAVELWGREPRAGDPNERYCGSFKIFHPDGRFMPHAECPMARALRGETLAESELEILVERPDGARKHVLAHPEVLKNDAGKIVGAINCLYDITARKQAEAATRATEALLKDELDDLNRLQSISSQLIQGGNLGALYTQILDAAVAMMRSDMGSIQTLEPGSNTLRLLAWRGFDPASAAFWESVQIDSGSSCGVALATGERVIVPDVETCEFMAGTEDLASSRLSGIRSVQSTPLVSRSGRLVGMISTHWRETHQPSDRDLRLLDVLARQAADLIERTREEDEAALLAAIVTSTSDAIASKTLEGIITSWNASAEGMFGYTAREIIGQSVLLLIPPDRHFEEDRILAQLKAGERIEHYETVRLTKDGRELDVSLTISPVRNSAGVIIGASKIVQDITARKRNERLLAEQNSLLELIASGCAIEECLTEVTRAVTRLRPMVRAGVIVADAERQRIEDTFAAEISPAFGQGLRGAPINALAIGTCGASMYTGEAVACEDIANDQRWSPAWRDLCLAHGILACYSAPIAGSNGLALGSLMFCFDTPRAPTEWELRIAQFGAHLASIVIERARADNALRESEAKFRALADNVPHLAWMAHPDGSIFWYNRRWYDYTGTSPESQEGWGWQSVHDPAVLPAVTERWQHSLATGESFEMVFPLRGADGVFRPFLTRIVSIKDEQGRIVRWFGANTDITAQRETEEALRASELALQEANRQKDEFLGIASHELRTPLTSITGNVQLAGRTLARLTHEKPADEADVGDRLTADTLARLRLLMERTDRQVGRLDRLVGDLLDVSRISAGKLDMRPEPCDLLDIVRESVEGQRAAWPDRSLSITLPRRTRLPLVADADRIGQVVTNYVTNALKYSEPDRTVTVRVSAAKGQARVEVRDEGPGLTPEQQTRLFERFYRVPGIEQRSGSGVGLGLGLHICKTIIERHDGTVGVESAPGKGSVFWFTLPLADE